MPVDVKGRIVYNPDNEDQEYSIECKPLGIKAEGSGSIEDDIEELREKVIKGITEEFHVAPSSIKISGYVMSLGFTIEGPINHTLDKFTSEDKDTPGKDE